MTSKKDFEGHSDMKICEYFLGKTIGEGTFGKVKVGFSEKNNSKVAIKIMNRRKMKTMEVVGKVKREIRHLQKFQHPHIIQLYQVISTPTEIFMIMEFAAGGELFEYIVSRGRLSETEARKFFQQLISGVEYLHKNMVVHRDLKPENLLLDEAKKNIKIADFGLSNIMADGEFLATSCGSPNYAAPEVISANLYAGPEVDIWSSGIILYTLLCGSLPFDDDDPRVLFKQIRAGMFKVPSFLSPGAVEVLKGTMTVDPTRRWTVEKVKASEWFLTNLPAYLFAPVSHKETSFVNVEALATVAMKFACEESEVRSALMGGNPHHPMRIAYQIIVDNMDFQKASIIEALRRTKSSSTSTDSELDFNSNSKDKHCLNACLAPGQKFCRPDCDMCPKWGAIECVFAKFIPDLAKCDTCGKFGDAGCLFSLDKLNVCSGLDSPKKHPHPERIRRPPGLSHTLEYQVPDSEKTDSSKSAGRSASQPARARQKFVHSSSNRALWHLGIRANCNPSDVMRELYKNMKRLDFEWKQENFYSCLVRRKGSSDERPKLRLQLYKADNKGGYLVDFRSLCGDLEDMDMSFDPIEDPCTFAIDSLSLDPDAKLKSSETMQYFDMCAEIISSLSTG